MPFSAVQPQPRFNFQGRSPGGTTTGSRSIDVAVRGAKSFKDALGLPDYQDIFNKIGAGSKEFGNAGAAGTGADFAKSELERSKLGLAGQQANIAKVRNAIQNPTGTEGFKNVMRLTGERLGHAAEQSREAAAEAASRRGFVGGYSPERTERDRLEALSTSGYEAAAKEREAQQALFGGEVDLYGNQLGQYGQQLGAYTDLTKTQAELPTKWLNAYSGLLSGLGGGFGDIFGTALKGTMFDEENRRSDVQRNRSRIEDARNRIQSGTSSGSG